MRKPTYTGRAMMPHGWPTPMEARIYTLKQLARRYAAAFLMGALTGGPAAVWVTISHFCK